MRQHLPAAEEVSESLLNAKTSKNLNFLPSFKIRENSLTFDDFA